MRLKVVVFCSFVSIVNIICPTIKADSGLIIGSSNKVKKQTIAGTISESTIGYSLRSYNEVKKVFEEYIIPFSVGNNEQINLKKFIGKKVVLSASVVSVKETKSKDLVVVVKLKNPSISKIYSVELL